MDASIELMDRAIAKIPDREFDSKKWVSDCNGRVLNLGTGLRGISRSNVPASAIEGRNSALADSGGNQMPVYLANHSVRGLHNSRFWLK